MTAFHEARLPARLAFGSTGGVERRTEITTLASGFERRSTPWAMGRRRYLIGAVVVRTDEAVEARHVYAVGAVPAGARIAVSQCGEGFGWGLEAEIGVL